MTLRFAILFKIVVHFISLSHIFKFAKKRKNIYTFRQFWYCILKIGAHWPPIVRDAQIFKNCPLL